MGRRRPVVFDLDGVLIDSETLAWDAWRTVLGRYEMSVSDEDVAALTGRTEQVAYNHFAARGDLPEFERFWEEIATVTFELFDARLTAYEDAVDTLDYLTDRGFQVAVASSSPRSRVDRSLRSVELDGRFDFVVGGDEVVNGKPDPEIFLAAAAGLGVAASDCIAVEDAPAGVQAAKAAGMRVLAVERGMFSREELSAADLIVPRLTPAPFLD